MATEEDFEPTPPNAERVARRLVVLTAVACRGSVEGDQGAADFWQQVRAWFGGLGVEDELEPAEREIIETPFGALAQRAAIDAGWLCEGASVLAWALGKYELPPLQEQCQPFEIGNGIGLLQAREATILAAPSLRGEAELDALEATCLAAHWRLREYELRPQAIDFIARATGGDWASGGDWETMRTQDVEIVGGDLAIGGVPIHQTDARARAGMSSIVRERHRAANWLTGSATLWSEVTTDT